MKNLFRLLLCGLVALASVPARATAPDGPNSGKVLVLDNECTIEGDVERFGDRYRVCCGGGTTWVPGERVLRVCASKEEAFAFLRRRANLNDPDERLRLARWCYVRGLTQQALAEVKAAVELRPDHDESRRLLHYLEQPARPAAKVTSAPAPALPPLARPPIELSADALSRFATQVQPILMNACARCHVAGACGDFRLQRTYAAGLTNRRTTQQNLAAVLAQLNLRQPERSKLLVKAISAHGPTGEAPLRGRQAEAFKTLDDWVKLTLSNNPSLVERLAIPTPAVPAPAAPAPKTTPAPVRTNVPVVPSATPATKKPRPTPVTPAPARRTDPADDYDPDQFNHQTYPDRASPPP
jgi:hypothetical protein